MKTKRLLTLSARTLAVSISLCVAPQLLAQASSGCVAKPAGLISWWRAEGDSSDSIGTNHGTNYGAVAFAPGKVGQAFVFDGASHVRVPDVANLNFGETSPITVELWAYRTGTASIMHFMGKRVECGADTFNYQMAFNENNPGEGLSFGGGASSPGHAVLTGLDMPMTNWVYLVGTFDGSTFRFYTNGVLAASEAGTLGPTSSASLTIGGSGYEGACMPFYGLIDEVAIYNRALSDAEILAIYNAGSDGKCAQDDILATIRVSQIEICWNSATNARYQVQYRSDLTTNAWTPLIQCVPGSVSNTCVQDAVLVGQPQRFYRVVLTNCVPSP